MTMPTLIGIKNLPALTVLCAALILAGCGNGTSQNSAQTSQGGSLVGAVANEQGYYPDWRGLYPDANGRYPDYNGNYPDANGNYPDYNELYPDSAGRYPDWRGIYPDSSGRYPTEAEAGILNNEFGWARTYSTLGPINTDPSTNAFFKPLGNGRSCATCHDKSEGFSVTPTGLVARFNQTNGTDPIFRVVDGSNSPNAPVGTVEERFAAYSMLLNRGVIRIGKKIPDGAEFVLDSVVYPTGFGSASADELSLFRRILPSTNLKFLGAVMWDERETLRVPRVPNPNNLPGINNCQNGLPTAPCFEVPFGNNLKRQANGAVTGHAEFGQGLTDAEQNAIVNFELSLFTAQQFDKSAKFLSAARAKGGPNELSNVDYYFDINGFVDPRTGLPGNKLTTMQLFGPWASSMNSDSTVAAARASIARGERIFNTRRFTMESVPGTNITPQNQFIRGATCTNCHKTPQVGSLSVPNSFNLGISDPIFWNKQVDNAGNDLLPVYTLRNILTGATVKTYDPGLALVTGKWGDIGKFKTPGLRGLATRAPYFHDGSAKTIEETTAFYLRRFTFDVPMTAQDITDLNAFLKSL